jgi:HD-like signal output (HDOD) protein
MNNNNQVAIPHILKSLYPISQLGDPYQDSLLNKAAMEKISSGHIVHALPDREWLSFLIEGKLQIQNDKDVIETIEAGTPRSRMPIFRLHSDRLSATSRSKSLLLRINKKGFEALLEQGQIQNNEGEEEIVIGENKGIEESLVDSLYKAYTSSTLDLPSLPDVALKIHRAIDNPDISVRDIAKLVHTDPTLSAKIVQTANSAAYRASRPIETVRDATARLGLRAAQSIAMSLSIKKLFIANSSLIHSLLQEFYHHSLVVGSLCYVIAKKTGKLNPEKAMLAGLIHDIGIVPIMVVAKKKGLSLGDEQRFRTAVAELRGIAGNIALSSLGFDQEMITVAEQAEEWYRDPAPEPDYCDIVIIAQLHSYLGTPMMKKLPQIDKIPAYHKLQPGEFDPVTGLHILQDGKSVAQSLQALLG